MSCSRLSKARAAVTIVFPILAPLDGHLEAKGYRYAPPEMPNSQWCQHRGVSIKVEFRMAVKIYFICNPCISVIPEMLPPPLMGLALASGASVVYNEQYATLWKEQRQLIDPAVASARTAAPGTQ
ncbi:hypothetical protein GRJ2_001182900 [Grus japonensis]|uniref:Uncharacterized protein n=1 Tax=Grus japonensis TaxID=30415 RepID=A0ABC9WPR0_GRUJA